MTLLRSNLVFEMGKIPWEMFGYILGVPVGVLLFLYLVMGRHRKINNMKDKVVLITGATSGLGRACARVFLQSGSRVILAGRSVDKLKQTFDSLKTELSEWLEHEPKLIVMDLEDVTSLSGKVTDALRFYGHIDVLVNNAGISFRGRIEDTPLEIDWKVMLINYFGQIAITKALLPSMLVRKSGHIVGISSIQGRFSIPYRSAYSASKHAFQAFFDALRSEVADRNIHVSVISPSYICTNLSQNAVCSDGSQHGVTDATTASGMSPEYVARRVLQAVEYNQPEVILSSLTPRVALYARTLLPNVFFKFMKSRAKKQSGDYVKKKSI